MNPFLLVALVVHVIASATRSGREHREVRPRQHDELWKPTEPPGALWWSEQAVRDLRRRR